MMGMEFGQQAPMQAPQQQPQGGGMDDAALYELWQAMTGGDPEVARKLAESGLFAEQMGMAGQDMAQGQGMMQTPGAEGMRVGGTYVASSPVEHASVAMSRVMGARQMQDARKAQTQAMGGVTDFRQAMLDAMSKRGQPSPMQQDPNAAAPWLPPMPYTTY